MRKPLFPVLLVFSASILAGCGAPSPGVSSVTVATAVDDDLEALRAYPVIELLGVGAVYAERLAQAGVTHTDHLKARTGTRSARERLARASGIPYGRLLPIAQAVELMRIKGIGVRQANLLQAVGVASVKELARRVPSNLHDRIGVANRISRPFVQRAPGVTTVTRWVTDAKALVSAGQGIGD
ncbi:MAG: DUF4332 domain-containing protein [Candidatus Sericytochromatia bacterium]|nr:DUF4332 domain-containing protein [Candidatus Sericytochromatia bacterium]